MAFAPDVHTVLTASWTSAAPGPSWVEYDLDGETQRTPVVDDGGTAHAAVLLGLRPLTDVAWTLVTGEGDERAECAGVTQTENVVPQIVGLTVDAYHPELSGPEPFVFGSASTPRFLKGNVFVASKEDGSFRWYAQGNERSQLVQAELARGDDGSSALANGVLYNEFDFARTVDVGSVTTRAATGEITDVLRTPLGHHAFAQLPDGTTAYLSLETRTWVDGDGVTQNIAGDTIHEVAPDGTDTRIFSVYDYQAVSPNPHWNDTLYPGYLDWSHADGLRWNDKLQAYVVPFAHLEQVWLIGRDGVPKQRLGEGTPIPAAPGFPWELPHDATILDDGSLLVFLVNQGAPSSGCHQFTIGTAELTPIWGYDASTVGRFLGKCSRLPGGNTLVGFGSGGVVHEVTPAGEVAWAAHGSDVAGLGSIFLFSDLYPPE